MELGVLGIILAAVSGLYAFMWRNHNCIHRVETKLDSHLQFQELKEEIIDLKDEIRQLE